MSHLELPGHATALRVGPRAALVLGLASLIGLAMFCWPLLVPPDPQPVAHADQAPLLFVLLLPVILAVVLAEISEGGIDPKTLALLGVLAAVNAALRPLGAGTAGIETVFFLLVLAGRVFGPGFGFALGTVSLFASALLTAGVGPWLPFQMMAAGWVGLGAGLLPRRVTGRAEIVLLAGYGVVSAYAFGFFMNLWFWPFAVDDGTQLSMDPEAGPLTNLRTFALYTLATSSLGWDTGRALTNAAAIAVLGPAVLVTLRRAARRAAFDAPVSFTPPEAARGPAPARTPKTARRAVPDQAPSTASPQKESEHR
ncbi:energy-coupling factor transport system substrate-specific component [Streptomyces zhaozhouensis]|uniref:Energy-coupling factor transport system substrate-specific component n=1 Tax=Streptomyces zhaozhouensis TaxID=1300267 RepID=A0A286DXC1_9ACTN|nr:ECF transporter S component [Streptomyces zhaozhouensis]SOD63311.1 energy-coupling factor transport system substrate-specific component [Streptomyces zhaozhouensis]